MWNTLYVSLETGWQCTLIPGPQYFDLTCFGRGYRDLPARWLYPNAGRDRDLWSWNALPEVDESELWEKDRLRQLTQDRVAFVRHFRPNWDLHTITGEKALREVQTFVRDRLKLAHWNLPTDVAEVRKLLCDAVASGRLVPVINREYRGLPRVAQPDPAPQRWPAMGGGGNGYQPKVISYDEFLALQRANGELPALDTPAGGVGVTLDPLPNLGAPAKADDGFGLPGFVESAAGVLFGGVDENTDIGDTEGDDGVTFGGALFSADSGGDSTSLGDARPFNYQPDSASGSTFDVAGIPNMTGDPNSWIESGPGMKKQWRMFGSDGSAAVDIDFDSHHGQPNPHAHNWDGNVRDQGWPVSILPW
ncbi:hypothetical protein [Paraburkholderia acidiphila]|uniref:Uncharacterized protein n=1 Tax=Paraburkholderia acidiphila TaxID=2571747 RepID=A0A7Z2J6Z3_9BURK|nr:hypothetical protein [Paraburkholderia acidiphila]QGZ53571.1 hypothetical protein FAZ97_00870 [Paraburkholderia acidiphila]